MRCSWTLWLIKLIMPFWTHRAQSWVILPKDAIYETQP